MRCALGPTASCSTLSSWSLARRMLPTTTPVDTTPSARRSSTWWWTGSANWWVYLEIYNVKLNDSVLCQVGCHIKGIWTDTLPPTSPRYFNRYSTSCTLVLTTPIFKLCLNLNLYYTSGTVLISHMLQTQRRFYGTAFKARWRNPGLIYQFNNLCCRTSWACWTLSTWLSVKMCLRAMRKLCQDETHWLISWKQYQCLWHSWEKAKQCFQMFFIFRTFSKFHSLCFRVNPKDV